MATIYVVETGMYDDRAPASAWSDVYEADAVAAETGGEVYEVALDAALTDAQTALKRVGVRHWRIVMQQDGSEPRAWIQGTSARGGIPDLVAVSEWQASLVTTCYARDEAHAIEIADERRLLWIAGGKRVQESSMANRPWQDAIL